MILNLVSPYCFTKFAFLLKTRNAEFESAGRVTPKIIPYSD